MKLSRGIALIVAAVLAAASAAPAAAEPRQTWTGFYVGLHGGYGWTPGRTSLDALVFGVPTPWYTWLDSTEFPDHHGVSGGGFMGGVQAGYSHQVNAAVLGFEADISYSALSAHFRRSGSVTGGMPPTTKDYIFDQWHDLEWLATFRGRLGVAHSHALLVYATGGLAIGAVKNAIMLEFTSLGGTDYAGSRSSTRTGWTAGFGVEHHYSDKLTTKFEYLYYDLGKTVTNGVDILNALNPAQPRAHVRNNGHIVRLGVNFRSD